MSGNETGGSSTSMVEFTFKFTSMSTLEREPRDSVWSSLRDSCAANLPSPQVCHTGEWNLGADAGSIPPVRLPALITICLCLGAASLASAQPAPDPAPPPAEPPASPPASPPEPIAPPASVAPPSTPPVAPAPEPSLQTEDVQSADQTPWAMRFGGFVQPQYRLRQDAPGAPNDTDGFRLARARFSATGVGPRRQPRVLVVHRGRAAAVVLAVRRVRHGGARAARSPARSRSTSARSASRSRTSSSSQRHASVVRREGAGRRASRPIAISARALWFSRRSCRGCA